MSSLATNILVPSVFSSMQGDSEESLKAYLKQIKAFPMLDKDEEVQLSRRWLCEGDKEAAHKLVTSHLRLVVKIASGYRGYGLSFVDLVSEGNIGLMRAVKKFDPEKGFRLSTYAIWWIKAAITEYIMHSWSLVKIGTTVAQKKLFFNLRKMKNKIKKYEESSEETFLSDSEIDSISKDAQVSRQEVINMEQRLTNKDQSLNKPRWDSLDNTSQEEAIDWLPDTRNNFVDEIMYNSDLDFRSKLLQEAIGDLNVRERDILISRRLKEKPDSLEILSHKYKVSKERIRQIEMNSFSKLQEKVTSLYKATINSNKLASTATA